MQVPPLSTACVACHSNGALAPCRRFTDAASAYTFALNQSVAGNPGASVFLQKNIGGCAGGCPSCVGGSVIGHSGGAQWSGVDPAGATAVTNWINGGRAPEPAPNQVSLMSTAAFELFRKPSAAQDSKPSRLPARNR